jgi:hypothetical protein
MQRSTINKSMIHRRVQLTSVLPYDDSLRRFCIQNFEVRIVRKPSRSVRPSFRRVSSSEDLNEEQKSSTGTFLMDDGLLTYSVRETDRFSDFHSAKHHVIASAPNVARSPPTAVRMNCGQGTRSESGECTRRIYDGSFSRRLEN